MRALLFYLTLLCTVAVSEVAQDLCSDSPAHPACLPINSRDILNFGLIKPVIENYLGLKDDVDDTDSSDGDCCYTLQDVATGYWTKKHKGGCRWGCLGEVGYPGLQTCKTCTCNNPDSGTGQGGTKAYDELC
ncbi:hypothetical protein BKA57DRAFT_497301 [Linnemannia elongata]|nr:hypothetical protein BKA57DRAFT_497301 [Linnemannia elongata]